MAVTLNASTSTGYVQTADTSGDLAIQSNGTTQFNVTSTGAYGQLKSGTTVTASGTSVDFTSLPSWVKRITIMFAGLSTNGTSDYMVQLGDLGGFETTGYLGSVSTVGASTATYTAFTTGLGLVENISAAANVYHGLMTISLQGSNLWVSGVSFGGSRSGMGGSSKTLSDTLDRVRITTVGGVNTFDAGTINILYEG